ncbi:hypothetical protein AB0F17_35065 [Nonomuraea sp. NPDC026600]|uniref:hypothetical protein n=1 Tax=Nonomuraea sp. NPDC026600 TaxID=3155363 RepID=UPI0033CB3DD8
MAATTSRTVSTLARKAKQAHKKVLKVREEHGNATHPRDLAALTLVLGHKRKAEPVMRHASLTRSMWHNEIKPHAPLKLPDWSADEALAVIDVQREKIKDIDVELEEAMDERAKFVAALAELYSEELGSRGVNAAISRVTDFNLPLIKRDLERAGKLTAKAQSAADTDGQADAGDTSDDTAGLELLPAPQVAERLGTTLNKFLARIKDARAGDGPIAQRGRGRVMLFDVEKARAWWVTNRYDWLSAAELAERWDVEPRVVRERLRGASNKGTTPEHIEENGRYRYKPEAADTWWEGLQKHEKAVAEGVDAEGRWNTARLARELGVSSDKVKDVTRGWREKSDLTEHVVDERGHRWWNPEPFLAKWRAGQRT